MKEKKERIRQLIEENEGLKKNIEASYDEVGFTKLFTHPSSKFPCC